MTGEIAILDLKPFLYSGLKKPEVLLGSVKMGDETFEREVVHCGGVLYALQFIRNQLKGYNILGCMDSRTLDRKKIYPQYKANRAKRLSKADWDALNQNIDLMNVVFDYVGIPLCVKAGAEADDLIASAVNKYTEAEHISVFTPDSDLRCWVSPRVSIRAINSRTRDVVYTEGTPYAIISMYKAVYGDTSDNVPPAPEPDIGTLVGMLPNESMLLEKERILRLSKILYPENENLHRNIQLVYQDTDLEVPPSLPVVDDVMVKKLNKAIGVLSGYEQDAVLESHWVRSMQ